MDSLILLHQARVAGLIVTVDGNRLKIRGPRQAEPVVKELIANKTAIIGALQAETQSRQVPASPWALPMRWYGEWVEMVLAIRDEGVPLELAEARAFKAILARMCWASAESDT